MTKVSGMKRKKVPTNRSAPSSPPSAPARCSLTMPSNGAASTTRELFDEMAGSGSNNVVVEFVHLLDTNTVDIDQDPIAGFDYNEMEGGVDDHGGEDEVEEDKIAQQQYKDMEASEGKIFKQNKDRVGEKKAREKQERWQLLKEIEERRAHVAENKAMSNLLDQDNMIMILNRNDMDDINKE
ncbi:galacturonosyltransferase 14 [Hordeum vulgare]|nr:galacturonosyltransferase 14 [Hordeum vulgare]